MAKPTNTYDLVVLPNQTFHLGLTLQNDDGSPIDLAPWSFTGSIKKSYTDPTPFLFFTCSILDATSGSMQVYLSADTTWLMKDPRYYYDIIANISSSVPEETVRVLQGVVKTNAGVTTP